MFFFLKLATQNVTNSECIIIDQLLHVTSGYYIDILIGSGFCFITLLLIVFNRWCLFCLELSHLFSQVPEKLLCEKQTIVTLLVMAEFEVEKESAICDCDGPSCCQLVNCASLPDFSKRGGARATFKRAPEC